VPATQTFSRVSFTTQWARRTYNNITIRVLLELATCRAHQTIKKRGPKTNSAVLVGLRVSGITFTFSCTCFQTCAVVHSSLPRCARGDAAAPASCINSPWQWGSSRLRLQCSPCGWCTSWPWRGRDDFPIVCQLYSTLLMLKETEKRGTPWPRKNKPTQGFDSPPFPPLVPPLPHISPLLCTVVGRRLNRFGQLQSAAPAVGQR